MEEKHECAILSMVWGRCPFPAEYLVDGKWYCASHGPEQQRRLEEREHRDRREMMAEMESINDPTTWGRRRQVQQALLERKAAAYDRLKAVIEEYSPVGNSLRATLERIIKETEGANG